jgi:hypothetical protein
MSGVTSPSASSGPNHSAVPPPHNYDRERNSDNHRDKPPYFNSDPTTFPFWKTKMYSYIIGTDDELWDIIEDGIHFEHMDDEGIVRNTYKKFFDAEKKKQYKKHHTVKNMLIGAISHAEYLKISNKSCAKTIWDSLCSTYEGNKQVKEAKANLLVHQYELFRMKEDEDIETMYSRFQTLVKSYTASDHVKKILRSLPSKWRPKVTAFQESKDLDNVTLEDLISSLRSHELELMSDEPVKKMKSLALSSVQTSSKAAKIKVSEQEEETSDDMMDENSENEEMALMVRRFQKWNKKYKRFPNKGNNSRSSFSKDKKEELNKCYNCKKSGHFIADCPEMSSKDRGKNKSFGKEKYKEKVRKSLLATWETIENDSEGEDDEEGNLALMARTSEGNNSDRDSEDDSDDENEVYSNMTKSELIDSLKIAVKHYTRMVGQHKILKNVHESLKKDAKILYDENESLNIRICHVESNYVLADNLNDDHEDALHEFIRCTFNRSKMASMIYHMTRNYGEGIGYSRFKNWDKPLKSYSEDDTPPELFSTFVKSGTLDLKASNSEGGSEPEPKDSEVLSSSEPKISEFKSSQVKAQKSSEPLRNRGKVISDPCLTFGTMIYSRSKSKNQIKPKHSCQSLINSRSCVDHRKQIRNTIQKTNSKGPIRIWVPKSEIVFASDAHARKGKTAALVPGQWLLTTYDGRKAYVPNPNSEGGRLCGVWRKTKREDHWYRYSW